MTNVNDRDFPELPWIVETVAPKISPSLKWTQDFATYTLRSADLVKIVDRCKESISNSLLHFDDVETLLDSCVSALLVGHLVLQGPPGTGKTTLARILSEAFDAVAFETTATSEWSTFDVVGGLTPNRDGGLEPTYGAYTKAVIECARAVRTEVRSETDSQATWLIIDEFNRADIDKAIGSLYTILSSTDPEHLAATPLKLWFESGDDAQWLWVPARFRIIGTMNDLDTNYVNSISQGLKRRFSFVTVPSADPERVRDDTVDSEVRQAYAQGSRWYTRCYATSLGASSDEGQTEGTTDSETDAVLLKVQSLVKKLRGNDSGVRGWPVGSAQVVDLMKYLLLGGQDATTMTQRLDGAVAERLVAQFENLSGPQLEAFTAIFQEQKLPKSLRALQHVYNPYAP